MKKIWFAIFIVSLVVGIVTAQNTPCRPSKHSKVPTITGLPYHKARTRLLAFGWQPFRTKSFNRAKNDPDIAYGNGRLFWKRGYVEVEFCSGTGIGACGFLFKDVYGNRLRVTTEGEEFPKQRAYATVNSFRFVCE